MKYFTATFLDKNSYGKHGLNWLRTARANSMQGYIVGEDLSDEAVSKITELGFTHLPVEKKYNHRCDIHYTLLNNLPTDSYCLWTENNLVPKNNLETKMDICCDLSKVSAYDMTVPVVNLHDRAAMIHSLEEMILKQHGAMLSSSYLLGSFNFWNGYVGCQTYLYQKQYLDTNLPAEDLILNFFMAFANSISLEIKNYV